MQTSVPESFVASSTRCSNTSPSAGDKPACTGAPPAGLERSGGGESSQAIPAGDWLRDAQAVEGVSRLHAGLKRRAYASHRHDSYTIALTESGVQEFSYRRSLHHSLPGQVLVLHPDELHDGRPCTEAGFSYRTLYMDPGRIYEAVRAECGMPVPLPFVDPPVMDDPLLARAIAQAFEGPLEPLRADELVQAAATSLLRAARTQAGTSRHRLLGEPVLRRAREYLDAHFTRIVSAEELAHECDEDRFTIAAQFRRRFGTSPYRYLLMRRLAFVRAQLPHATSLAGLALQAGFADQAHMTRMFKSAYGLTPDVFARLSRG
jgi:AraC-like DNA-binding protein